ncbi:outer membrane receptor protein [Belliella baltica DSM 15883]|uniref:Outer membrane receptor protein n=1 Tax=Belliella baltica (strain DSM 15883 / CIP 108006 / LMG 21964 / BA134) TaxID=866536 RepID=I3Z1Z9_BELBD|nr:TonB-dependent receptor [Belliella baltica]AFL83267.1 outer membrane receptor protein [Belliella baltica DSM 15883]
MKQLGFTLALLLVCFVATAQNKINGTVKDASTGELLAGTNVLLEGTGRGSTTDISGNFEIRNIPQGTYDLRVSFLGYTTQTLKITVPNTEEINISLEQSSIFTEEFVVNGTRASDVTPTTFQNIKKEEIAKLNLGQDIPMLLNYTPSVVSFSDAGAGVGYTGLRIRGSDQTRINVTVNGIPMNDAESHGVFWVNMPDFASSVDNMQIQRGVGTSTNGAATFGASINIQTDTRQDEAYGEIDNSFGSFNTRRHTVKAGTGLLNNRWAFDARLSQITSDGYMDRASSNLKSYFLTGGYYGENHVFKLNVFSGAEKTYQAWEGVPEALLETNRTFNLYTYDNQTDNYQQDHYQFIYTGKINQNWKANGALHYTYGRGYYEQFRENDRLSSYDLSPVIIGGESISRMDIIRRRWLDNDFFGGVFSLNYISNDARLDAVLGGGINRYDGDHFGEIIWMQYADNVNIRDRYYDNNAVKDDRNVYLKGTYEASEGLFLFGDLQYRGVDYRFDGLNNDLRNVSGNVSYNFFNPKFGLTYQTSSGNSLYASYAVANREPVRRDFTDSPIVDRAPQAENLQNIEAGIKANTSKYAYNVNFYYMNYNNQLVLTGQLNDVGAYVRDNVANSYRAGIEIDGAYNFSPQFTFGGNLAISRNKISEFTEYIDDYSAAEFFQEEITYTDTDIAFSPNVVASAILDYKPIKNFEISLLNKYVGSQYMDNTMNDNRMLDAFWTTDLRLNYALRPRFVKNMEFTLMVYNIFNKLYEPNGYTFSYFLPGEGGAGRELTTENFYYPMAGTNFLAGVKMRF